MNATNKKKYNAIEKAMFDLRQVGYNIDDKIYLALVAERARLESNNDEEPKIEFIDMSEDIL